MTGEKAIDRLKRERREAKQRQRDEDLIRRAVEAAPLMIEGPRADELDRVAIVTTAEMTAFDLQTAELAKALAERHDGEMAAEEKQRRIVTAEAAVTWYEALTEPVALDDDLVEALRQPVIRGPKPG